MKRFLSLLVCTFIFNSCDDGDINFKSFNFDTAAPVTDCPDNNGLFFKINGNEALILQIPLSSFPNEVTPAGENTVLIDSQNKVIYRLFSGTVTNNYFCSSVPPVTPTVSDEWTASNGVADVSGMIEITTTEIINTDNVLTGYNHFIVFKNVTFLNSENSFVYESYIFGNYVTSI